jgi:hypothetical protein
MNEMEEAIINMIECKYKCKYTGHVKVTKLGKGGTGYKVKLDFDNLDKPIIQISADLNAEDFLKFVEQELVSRQLHRVKFFRGVKIYPEDEERRTC